MRDGLKKLWKLFSKRRTFAKHFSFPTAHAQQTWILNSEHGEDTRFALIKTDSCHLESFTERCCTLVSSPWHTHFSREEIRRLTAFLAFSHDFSPGLCAIEIAAPKTRARKLKKHAAENSSFSIKTTPLLLFWRIVARMPRVHRVL